MAEASTLCKFLNGLFVVYKPAGQTFHNVRSKILHNLCRDLNSLHARPPSKRIDIKRTELVSNPYKIMVSNSFSDLTIATGPRYQMVDFKCVAAKNIGKISSGVLLMGIDRDGICKALHIRNNASLRTYRVTGKLGSSTENNLCNSRVVERAKFDHIYVEKLTELISSLQGSHQRKAFEQCQIDLQSQVAYDVAVGGPILPPSRLPIIHNIKCLEFRKPYFTLEISSANETEDYLAKLIYEIGLNLQTVAHCVKITCIRHGIFTIDDSLTRENWNIEKIISNMALCNKKLAIKPDMIKPI
ncbi:pseudouridylate synthase TRUB2, mitochondrial [Culicoides brevitarsis]|uniref:pseudouridylate synthase TRUB2, mitochondrial n=1 Tax=Culicoides brevitarsis TaxID=469753 RepID=UPI00307BF463